ncbi:MAG: flagellar filament capping protein FliD [Gammaproteobacteria bacterium]
MATISAAGVGSGLDIQSIVSQLMEIERQPLQRLQLKQNQLEAQISAYGQLSSTLSSFQTAMENLGSVSALKVFNGTSSNADVVNVTATSNAELGRFGVEVVRLAENHKIASKEVLNTDTFGGRRANDALTIRVGSDPADTVTVDLSTAKTLSEIRTAINDDPNNPGVTATIIHGDNNKQKMILTADDSGADNALTITTSGRVRLSDFDFQTLNDIGGDTSLLDAEFNIDGYNITRSSNTISDVISGVTLNLVSADPGMTHNIAIERDLETVKEAVQSFADAFNELRTSIKSLRNGQLEADSSLLSIERQVFSVLNNAATGGTYSVLSEIGLSMQKDGTMSLSSSDLESALQTDFDGVAQLFAADGQGFANRLESLADSWLSTGGLIDSREDGLKSRVDDLVDRQISFERNLELVESRYLARFTALDALVGQLQGTGQFLTNQLAQLPGLNQGQQ